MEAKKGLYFVKWKTAVENGRNSEGDFVACLPIPESVEDAASMTEYLAKEAKEIADRNGSWGGKVLISSLSLIGLEPPKRSWICRLLCR